MDLTEGLPRDERAREGLMKQMAESLVHRSAEGGPKLRIPEDQRAGWIEAWNRMRECTRQHGFDGVTPVAPSFGDGETNAPIVFGPGADAALEACPLDTSLFDTEKLADSMRATSSDSR